MGNVITFYSYKGGVGRSMALANIGVLLARWNKKVLLIDWDLEAPGLENYFKPLISDFSRVIEKDGLIDLLHKKTEDHLLSAKSINWKDYFIEIPIDDRNKTVYLLTSGKKDEHYVSKIRQFDFQSFYNDHDGGDFLEDRRTAWKNDFDFVLIDSRTGLTDSSGICSIQMPDTLVLLFTATEQGFLGTINVAKKSLEKHKKLVYDRLKLKFLPIPTRFDNSELKLTEEWLALFATDLKFLYDETIPRDKENNMLIQPSDILKKTKVPYISFYGYGEKLPVIEQGTDDPNSIGFVYETITAILANNFTNIQKLKDDRDVYVKIAKGEDVLDYAYYENKISKEQEEKRILEERLASNERQLLKQRKATRMATYIIGGIIVVVLVFFIARFINGNDASTTETESKDSAVTASPTEEVKPAYDTAYMAADTFAPKK
jgi:MinD-like ATPase involved in chromosome partitioning or flagellar assembly